MQFPISKSLIELKMFLTSSVAFPMNFPLFHQVMMAGGLEPRLRHSMTAAREMEKGSEGSTMLTFNGSTENENKNKSVFQSTFLKKFIFGVSHSVICIFQLFLIINLVEFNHSVYWYSNPHSLECIWPCSMNYWILGWLLHI